MTTDNKETKETMERPGNALLSSMDQDSTLARAGYLIGFALGGFFDGILLHQILQWHHLLSAIDGDIHFQILVDGLFHALMYVIAVAGLWKLIQARHGLTTAESPRRLAAASLIGFGSWHVIDGLLSHWVLGIHRIRMDTPNPLFWDLLWFVVFGILFLLIGVLLRPKPPSSSSGVSQDRPNKGRQSANGQKTALVLAGCLVASAVVATRPPPSPFPSGRQAVSVLLRPDTKPAKFLAGIQSMNARIIDMRAGGTVWLLAVPEQHNTISFYRHGAMLVSSIGMGGGCASWIKP